MLQTEDRAVAPATTWGEPRSKRVHWYDPLAVAAQSLSVSGREYLESIRAGEVPPMPIATVHGYRIDHIGDGEVEFSVTPDDSAYNPVGMVHGGFTATLLDTVVGAALQTTLPAGVVFASIELKVSYLRPVHGGTELVGRGRVTKRGSRVAFAEGEVSDRQGRVLATATSSLLVMPGAGD